MSRGTYFPNRGIVPFFLSLTEAGRPSERPLSPPAFEANKREVGLTSATQASLTPLGTGATRHLVRSFRLNRFRLSLNWCGLWQRNPKDISLHRAYHVCVDRLIGARDNKLLKRLAAGDFGEVLRRTYAFGG